MRIATLAYGLCLSSLLNKSASAEAPAAPVNPSKVSERIQIVGKRIMLDETPGSAQSLEAFELNRHSHSDINRVLRQLPGINLQEEDGFGLFPNIGIRGTRLERNSRITVMEDGVLIAPAPYTAPEAYNFPPVSRMHRVEVRKGSAAIKYGPYTTGGALNLLSTPIPESAAAKADVLFGSFGSQRTHLWAGGASDNFGWLLESSNSQSTGFKNADTALRSDYHMPRANTGFDQKNYLTKLRWNTSERPIYQEVELKLASNNLNSAESYLGLTIEDYKNTPYRRYAGAQADQMNSVHKQAQLRHFIQPSDAIDITTTVYQMDFARNWYKLNGVQNTAGGSYLGISEILANPDKNPNAMAWIRGEGGRDVLGAVRANNRDYLSKGIQSQLSYALDTDLIKHRLDFGIRLHQDQEDRLQWQDSYRMINGSQAVVRANIATGAEAKIESGTPGSTENRLTTSKATALYAQDTMTLGDWLIMPGVRHENIKTTRQDYQSGENPSRDQITKETSNSTSILLPGLGLSYKIKPTLIAIAGAHRGFAPTGPDSSIPEEKSWNYETGLRFQSGLLRSELIGFLTQYENLIGSCTAASGGGCEIGQQFDGGRVDVRGIEALAHYDLGQDLSIGYGIPVKLAYSLTSSAFKSDFKSSFADWGEVAKGYELPHIPKHQINVGIGISKDTWNINLNANYVSQTRSKAGSGSIAADQVIDSRTLLELAGELQFQDKGRVFASIENLSNERYLVARTPAGVRPGAPRISWLGLKLSI